MSDKIKDMLIPISYPKENKPLLLTHFPMSDTLIEKLEKLIEKKKNIKQGAMQELLTGKRRLPGFSGKLDIERLTVYWTIFTKDWD